MMNNFIKIYAVLAIVYLWINNVCAQTTYSGYFLDDYDYRYQMNPAFGNETSFVGMPVLGNVNFNMHGNLHVKDVVYTINGKSVLFTNPEISVTRAMSKFGNTNKAGTSDKVDILSGGFKAFDGYNTVTLSMVANMELSVPGSFFSLAKEGVTNDTYNIKNMVANANAYYQLSLNHSRNLAEVPGLRLGVAFKILVGAGNFRFRFNEASLMLGENEWIARTNAEVYASSVGFSYKTEYSDKTGKNYVSGGDIKGFRPTGFGLGFDFGAEYEWNDFKFSAAALDLGFINWGHTRRAYTPGTQEFTTDAFHFNVDNDAENSFKNEWNRLKHDVAELYQMTEIERVPAYKRALAATLNFGAQYELPEYRRLHFGLLNSTRINGKYTWTQFRLSANVKPVDYFSADVNLVAGTYGVGFGWLLNFHTTGFNMFLGMDQIIGKLAKQGVPLNSNSAFNLGINFPF